MVYCFCIRVNVLSRVFELIGTKNFCKFFGGVCVELKNEIVV